MLGSEILTANFHLITYLAGQKLEKEIEKYLGVVGRGGGGGGGGTRATTRN